MKQRHSSSSSPPIKSPPTNSPPTNSLAIKSPQAPLLVPDASSASVPSDTTGRGLGLGTGLGVDTTVASGLGLGVNGDALLYGQKQLLQQDSGSFEKPLQTALKHRQQYPPRSTTTAPPATAAATASAAGTSLFRGTSNGHVSNSVAVTGSGSKSLMDRMRAPFRVSFDRATTAGHSNNSTSGNSSNNSSSGNNNSSSNNSSSGNNNSSSNLPSSLFLNGRHNVTQIHSTTHHQASHSDGHERPVDERGLEIQGLEIRPPPRKIDPWDEFFRPEYLIIDLALVVGTCYLTLYGILPHST